MPRYASTGIAVASHGKQKPKTKGATQPQRLHTSSAFRERLSSTVDFSTCWSPAVISPFHICYSFDVLPPKCRDQRCQTVAVWRGDISLCILVEPILQIPGGFHSERSCVQTLSRTSQWASVLLPVGGGTGSWGLVRMRQHTVYFALAPLQPALAQEAAANTQQQLCARDLVLFFLTPAIA